MKEQKIEIERAAVVGLVTYDRPQEACDASLDELERLLETAGGSAVVRMVQVKDAPDLRTFLGSGKMKELAELCRLNDVTLVVCDDETWRTSSARGTPRPRSAS